MSSIESTSAELKVTERLAPNGSKLAVICIHGFCCSAGIFTYVSDKMSKMGYNVFTFDLPGHGAPANERGDLDFDRTIKEMDALISKIRQRHSRVFLLAHSMGSTFAIWYAHRFKESVDGLVLLSPYIRIPKILRSDAEPSPTAFLYLIFGRIFFPARRVDIRKVLPGYVRIGGSQYKRMTAHKEVNFEYSFRYMIDVVAKRNSLLATLSDIHVPVLVMYGLQDRNVYPKVSEEYFKMLKSENKKIVGLDCNHWYYDAVFYSQSDEYQEEDREAFVQKVVDWMDSVAKGDVSDH